jgi:hypothetical protein
MTPVRLLLRMNIGVTINLGRGCLEDTSLDPLGKAKAINRPHHGRLHRFDGIILVVGGRSRTCKIVNSINLELERVDHVVTDEFESGVPVQVMNVRFATGEKVVETNDIMSLFNKSLTEVGTEKAGAPSN